MQDMHAWQHRFRHLLAPPAALVSMAMRARARLYSKGLLRAFAPPVPTVGVGGIDSLSRGKVMVSAWLLGWARAHGIPAALLAGTRGAQPSSSPLEVTPETPVQECGVDAALLARYRPGSAILADRDPVRACKAALKAPGEAPRLLIAHDHFSSLSLKRSADIVLMGAHDLDKGWGRVFPAGGWREGAGALSRASAFVLHLWPDEAQLRRPLAERRLGSFEKPVFTVHPSIWRLRSLDGRTAQDLDGAPYLLVAAQSNQDVAAKACQKFLKLPPRLRVIFPDSHRFTPQDQAMIAADAQRIRAPHVLATPEAALLLGSVPGVTLWTFEPDVVIGPCLLTGAAFKPWWDTVWAEAEGE